MTSAKHFTLTVVLAIALQTFALGQDNEREDAERDEEAPLISFELTPMLLDNLLDKATDRLAKDYGLDDYQREQMRQVLQERVPAFIREHRDDLQRLVTEWTESVSAESPPSAESAADWAGRALLIVDSARGLLASVSEDMRGFLTDEQEVLLDGYTAGIDVAIQSTTDRLRVFKDGGFDPEIHWPGNHKARMANRQQARDLRREVEAVRQETIARHEVDGGRPYATPVAGAAPTPAPTKDTPKSVTKTPEKPADDWAQYVEQFIKRYQLDAQQSQKAHIFLEQQQQRRDQHLQRSVASMERVKKMITDAKTPRDRELAESAYQRFNQPIDRMFEKLKEKLNTLPTRAQRKAAAALDQESKKKDEQDHQKPQ